MQNNKDRDLIIGTLSMLGVAMTEHGHKWSKVERRAYEKAMCVLTASDSEPTDTDLLNWLDQSPARQVIGEANEFGQPRWIAQDRMASETIDCCGPTARKALVCAYNRTKKTPCKTQ